MDRDSAGMHENYVPTPVYLVRARPLLIALAAGSSKTRCNPLPTTNNSPIHQAASDYQSGGCYRY